MRMNVLSKLAVLTVAAGAMAVAAPASAGDLDGQEIKVCTWGGSWRDVQLESIVKSPGGLEARGARVEFVTGSPQDNMAKLIAARGQPVCDVIEILDATWDQMVELDFVVDELDFDQLPNAKHLADWQIGKNFTGSWFTQEGICYNADKFRENGIPEPTTYKDLIHPKLEGLIQIPDITSGGGLANFGGIVKAAGGDENNVKPGLDLINAMQVRKFWKRGSEGVTLLENGDIWALVAYVGWCMRGYKAGQDYLKFVHPYINENHTGVQKYGYLSIVKSIDRKNWEAAHAYINGFLSEETQYQMSTQSGTTPVNVKVWARLESDPVLKEMAMFDPEKIEMHYRADYRIADRSLWLDQWNRNVTQ